MTCQKKKLLIAREDTVFRFPSMNFGNTYDLAFRKQDHRRLTKRLDNRDVVQTLDFQINLATAQQQKDFLSFFKNNKHQLIGILDFRRGWGYIGFFIDNSSVNSIYCAKEINLTFRTIMAPSPLSDYDLEATCPEEVLAYFYHGGEQIMVNSHGSHGQGQGGAAMSGLGSDNPKANPDDSPFSQTDGVKAYWEVPGLRKLGSLLDQQCGLEFWIRDVGEGSIVGIEDKFNPQVFDLYIDAGKIKLRVQDTEANEIELETNNTFNFSDWKYVVVNYDRENTEIFVDNVQEPLTVVLNEEPEHFDDFVLPVGVCAKTRWLEVGHPVGYDYLYGYQDLGYGYAYEPYQYGPYFDRGVNFTIKPDKFLKCDLWKLRLIASHITSEERNELWGSS